MQQIAAQRDRLGMVSSCSLEIRPVALQSISASSKFVALCWSDITSAMVTLGVFFFGGGGGVPYLDSGPMASRYASRSSIPSSESHMLSAGDGGSSRVAFMFTVCRTMWIGDQAFVQAPAPGIESSQLTP